VQQLQGDKARLEGRLLEAQEQLQQARRQHEVDMQVSGPQGPLQVRLGQSLACRGSCRQTPAYAGWHRRSAAAAAVAAAC
jgi:hypothetical protein